MGCPSIPFRSTKFGHWHNAPITHHRCIIPSGKLLIYQQFVSIISYYICSKSNNVGSLRGPNKQWPQNRPDAHHTKYTHKNMLTNRSMRTATPWSQTQALHFSSHSYTIADLIDANCFMIHAVVTTGFICHRQWVFSFHWIIILGCALTLLLF